MNLTDSINVNADGYVALALAVLIFFAVHGFSKRLAFPKRLVLLGFTGVLSIPSLWVFIYYLHVIPETAALYEFRAFPASEYGIAFTGAASGVLAAMLPAILRMAPLLGVLVVGSGPYVKPLIAPLDYQVLQDRRHNDICLQSTYSTCGPASLCSILRTHGVDCTEQEIARLAYSYQGGTEAWYLARVVRQRGLKAGFSLGESFDPSAALPALVGVHVGGGHFIAVLSIKDGIVHFGDPMQGGFRIPLTDFQKRYRFSGFQMSVTR